MRTARGPPPRSVCRGGLPSEELGDLRLRAGGHGLCLVRRFSGLIIPQKPWEVVAAELAEYRASYCQVNGTDAPPTGGRRLNFWGDGDITPEGALGGRDRGADRGRRPVAGSVQDGRLSPP